jgi:hypothetical protein
MKNIILTTLVLLSLSPVYSQAVLLDSILINDVLPRRFSFKELENYGIKPDSIINAKPIDQYEPDSYIYIGSSLFWYYEKNDICEAHIIRFDKISSVRFGKYIINRTLTFENFQKIFPTDCKNLNPIRVSKTEVNQCCSIPVKDRDGQIWDMRMIFFFKNNTVNRIDFWEPM